MKLSELLVEILIDEEDEKNEYEVVSENDRGRQFELYRVRWDHQNKKVVIDIDVP